jgi:Raf kinase inhibitor-like YbhB/YbcL family protein
VRPQPTIAVLGALATAGVLAAGLAACDTGDGRELRPAGPDQTASLVNPTTTTLPPDPAVLGSGLPGEGVGEGNLTLRAPWEDEGVIDPRYTCASAGGTPGTGVSPELAWSGVPAGATNLALVVTDQTADGFVHLIATGIDPTATGVGEGLAPAGAVLGKNGFGAIGWGGPCPPVGSGEHEYLVELYALDQDLGLTDGFDADAALTQIQADSLGTVSLVGRFSRDGGDSSSTVAAAATVPPTVTFGPGPT